ncbi:BREX protein BrxB domain-containing protein [Cloacibacterium caeni]|uniref:BREX protein BrxB domain-containing protein n=1 Tax=Cloacibacterium caeni TaxID=2004710 RepID=UPI001BCB7E68|nr:BREX protein BrxB domain-containing protein [Cloacibacterium caeni]
MPETTINKIFQLLSREDFKDPDTGLLFFPVYIYTYPAEKEFQIREQIDLLNERLRRPSNNLNCLVINIYKELINYLKESKFAGASLFDSILELEQEDYTEALEFIQEKANENQFMHFIGQKFEAYFKEQDTDKIYLFLHGFGSVFPYLRLSTLLKNTEKYTKNFKLIAFYPGDFKNANYSLFGFFNDDNVYRANHLNKFI